jgi:hypothetical protein
MLPGLRITVSLGVTGRLLPGRPLEPVTIGAVSFNAVGSGVPGEVIAVLAGCKPSSGQTSAIKSVLNTYASVAASSAADACSIPTTS